MFVPLQLLFFAPQDVVSVDVSDNSWVRKSCCSDVYGSSVRIGGGEWIEIVVISGVGEGVPERGGY